MSLNPEDFGISQRDEFEIRFEAVRGALRDMKRHAETAMSDAEHWDAAARVNRVVEEIMADSGVSEIEARLILVEQLILSKNERDNYGEDI